MQFKFGLVLLLAIVAMFVLDVDGQGRDCPRGRRGRGRRNKRSISLQSSQDYEAVDSASLLRGLNWNAL